MNEDAPKCRLDWIGSTFGRVPSTTRDLRWRAGYAGLVRTSDLSAFRKASKEVDDVLDRVARNTKKYDDELLAGRSVVLPGESKPTKLPEHIAAFYREAGFTKNPFTWQRSEGAGEKRGLTIFMKTIRVRRWKLSTTSTRPGNTILLENTRVPG